MPESNYRYQEPTQVISNEKFSMFISGFGHFKHNIDKLIKERDETIIRGEEQWNKLLEEINKFASQAESTEMKITDVIKELKTIITSIKDSMETLNIPNRLSVISRSSPSCQRKNQNQVTDITEKCLRPSHSRENDTSISLLSSPQQPLSPQETALSYSNPLTTEQQDQLYKPSSDSSTDLIPSKSEQLNVLLHNMELIAEHHTEFSSDKSLSVDWSKYGCRLHIPEGSIPQGEIGTLDLYAIYSGPFKFPKNTSPVSAYYFISLSHILQKPAALELQHCYIINNDDDARQLTFASATTSTGPPYHFRLVDGGSFLPGRYALIHQAKFCFLGIFEALEWIKQSISRLFFGGSYAVLFFLIPVESPVLWNVKLFITKYTNAHYEYLKQKQEQESSEKPVYEDFQPFVLKEGVDTISIAVLPEEDGNEHQQVELKRWKGTRQVFGTNWEVIGSVTQVCITSVLETLSTCIPIRIEWTSEDPPERCVFRIHFLGVAKELSIPVIVPYKYQKSPSKKQMADSSILPVKMADVVRKFKGRICEKLEINDGALSALAVGFEAKQIIGPADLANVQRNKGIDGAIFLLNLVCDKIKNQGSGCLKAVFQVLKEVNHLSDIVDEMKEEQSPTPALAQCSLSDGDFNIFISYRWKDEQKKFADNLFNDLNRIPHVEVWKDDEGGINPGANLTTKMKSGIESSDLFVCVLSTDYFQSDKCLLELRHALEREKKFFPIEWVGRFCLPPEFDNDENPLKGMLRHRYDPEAINENTEARICVNQITAIISQ